MKPQLTKAPANALQLHTRFTPAPSDWNPRLVRNTFLQTILTVAISILAPMVAHAGSATWGLNPTSGDWNTAPNWTPMTVPNGPTDIATFALSNIPNISISANTEVNSIIFTPTATNPYLIVVPLNLTLTLSGTGITNNSGIQQSLYVVGNRPDFYGELLFTNASTAGNSTIYIDGGVTMFVNTSTAGSSNILNGVGLMLFYDNSTAGGAHIINTIFSDIEFRDNSSAGNVNISTADSSQVNFGGRSSAGNATMSGSGNVLFFESSNAGSATITSLGIAGFPGSVSFDGSSQGGTARIELLFRPDENSSPFLDISGHNAPGVAIGSIEGNENTYIILGANNLTVGSNNLSTTFSGVILDGGLGGSLTKIGSGTLILSGANTYTGDTEVDGGVLQVDGSISSNTFVDPSATLAGNGTVNGNVTNSNGGKVSPGGALGVPGVLTVADNYMQMRGATLGIQIGGAGGGQVSVLNVLGNANLNGFIDPELVNGFVPAIGQSFLFLDYASVIGSFSNIKNPVFDHGRKRWTLVYGPTSASLVVVGNGSSTRPDIAPSVRPHP